MFLLLINMAQPAQKKKKKKKTLIILFGHLINQIMEHFDDIHSIRREYMGPIFGKLDF